MDRKLCDLYAALIVARDEYEELCEMHVLDERFTDAKNVLDKKEKAFLDYAQRTLKCDPAECENIAYQQIAKYLISIGETDEWCGMPLEWYE